MMRPALQIADETRRVRVERLAVDLDLILLNPSQFECVLDEDDVEDGVLADDPGGQVGSPRRPQVRKRSVRSG